MRATWSNHAQDFCARPVRWTQENLLSIMLEHQQQNHYVATCPLSWSMLCYGTGLLGSSIFFSVSYVCTSENLRLKNLAMNEWTCKGSWDLFSLPDQPDSMERGSVCEGQMRLSVNQTHKNVWKRVVTKISVMLHFQSGNFHRMMTTHIKTRSLRMSENMEHVYFPTTREEESQLATEGISNESRVRMTQPTKHQTTLSSRLFLVFGCSFSTHFRLVWYCRKRTQAHKEIPCWAVQLDIWDGRFKLCKFVWHPKQESHCRILTQVNRDRVSFNQYQRLIPR